MIGGLDHIKILISFWVRGSFRWIHVCSLSGRKELKSPDSKRLWFPPSESDWEFGRSILHWICAVESNAQHYRDRSHTGIFLSTNSRCVACSASVLHIPQSWRGSPLNRFPKNLGLIWTQSSRFRRFSEASNFPSNRGQSSFSFFDIQPFNPSAELSQLREAHACWLRDAERRPPALLACKWTHLTRPSHLNLWRHYCRSAFDDAARNPWGQSLRLSRAKLVRPRQPQCRSKENEKDQLLRWRKSLLKKIRRYFAFYVCKCHSGAKE